jgi:Rrf2 family protein
MFSRTLEYALRAVVWLASERESPRTTREVAQATQVPVNYLAKVLQTLVERGIITSQRGLGGGFVLARDPAQLTVLDVVNAVEPFDRIRECPLKLTSHKLRLCPLHQRLDDAMAAVERAFSASSIASLLSESGSERPLCPNPAPVELGSSLRDRQAAVAPSMPDAPAPAAKRSQTRKLGRTRPN